MSGCASIDEAAEEATCRGMLEFVYSYRLSWVELTPAAELIAPATAEDPPAAADEATLSAELTRLLTMLF